MIVKDGHLRRLINHPDLGYGIQQDELWELVERLNSKSNRRRLRELVDAWEDPPEALSEDMADVLEPMGLVIESSASYRYAREETHGEPLPTQARIRRAHFLDRLERLGDGALGTLSEVFGNGIGLVETRKGKLWEQEDVRRKVRDTLQPLDLLLEKTPFRLTDFFIPGHFGHVAIWMGTEAELEALGVWKQPGMQGDPFCGYREVVAEGRSVLEALRSGVELNTLTTVPQRGRSGRPPSEDPRRRSGSALAAARFPAGGQGVRLQLRRRDDRHHRVLGASLPRLPRASTGRRRRSSGASPSARTTSRCRPSARRRRSSSSSFITTGSKSNRTRRSRCSPTWSAGRLTPRIFWILFEDPMHELSRSPRAR